MKRTRFSHLLLALLIALAPAALADGTPPIVVPPGNGLHLDRAMPGRVPLAFFSGRLWVKGTLRAQWLEDSGIPDAKRGLDLVLLLDQGEAERLPHFGGYAAESIHVKNGEDAVTLAYGKDLAGRLLDKHEAGVVTVHGRFQLESYVISIDCDTQLTQARLVGTDALQAPVSGNVNVATQCER
ncbi:MAG TPA: hypothetical protein VLG68_02455 [Gammaproteobacteria bacterium]|nr:hypothetical protein [Gammaproteobacteria bacterium]